MQENERLATRGLHLFDQVGIYLKPKEISLHSDYVYFFIDSRHAGGNIGIAQAFYFLADSTLRVNQTIHGDRGKMIARIEVQTRHEENRLNGYRLAVFDGTANYVADIDQDGQLTNLTRTTHTQVDVLGNTQETIAEEGVGLFSDVTFPSFAALAGACMCLHDPENPADLLTYFSQNLPENSWPATVVDK